tara:strand:+ start:1001 stop:1108 length:108 start_codon:yes stop_codon:yes gene_type:complete
LLLFFENLEVIVKKLFIIFSNFGLAACNMNDADNE